MIKKLKTFILIIALLFSSAIISQKLLGKKVSEFSIQTVLQAPVTQIESFNDIQGKWLFLEFWATWCAPCITKMPMLNDLQAEMLKNNDPIQFLSLSPERIEIVERFLKRKKINGWVGADPDKSVVKALNISAYPTTVLINPQGVIHSYIETSQVTRKKLLEIMQKAPVKNEKYARQEKNFEKLIVKSKAKLKPKKTSSATTIYEVSIEVDTLSTGLSLLLGKKQGRMSGSGISLSKLIAEAYGVSPFLIKSEGVSLDAKYKVKAKLPPGNIKTFESVLQSAIKSKLGLKVEVKKQDVTTYELLAPRGVSKNLHVTKSESSRISADEGIIAGSSRKIDGFFIGNLEETLKTKVYNKTGLEGKYDFNLYWDANNPLSIINAIERQLGLVLKEKKTETEVLYVTKK